MIVIIIMTLCVWVVRYIRLSHVQSLLVLNAHEKSGRQHVQRRRARAVPASDVEVHRSCSAPFQSPPSSIHPSSPSLCAYINMKGRLLLLLHRAFSAAANPLKRKAISTSPPRRRRRRHRTRQSQNLFFSSSSSSISNIRLSLPCSVITPLIYYCWPPPFF